MKKLIAQCKGKGLFFAIAVFLVPLLVSPMSHDPFEIDKISVIRAYGLVSLVVCLLSFQFKNITWTKYKIAMSSVGFWFSLLVIYSIIATFFSDNPLLSIMGSQLRGGGLLTLLSSFGIFCVLRMHGTWTEKETRQFSLSVSCVVLAISLLALLQYITHRYIYVDTSLMTTGLPLELVRPSGTFGHPLYLGIYLALSFPFLIYAFQKYAHVSYRLLIATSMIAGSSALYLTRSRISLLAVVITLLCYAYSTIPRQRLLMFFVGLCSVVFIGIYSNAFNSLTRTESIVTRMYEWKFATIHILKRPLWGYGYETYGHYSSSREKSDTEIERGIADRVHSIFLDTAWNVGIPGMMMLLVIMCIALMRCVKERITMWKFAIACSLATYLIVMVTSFDYSFTYVWFPFLLAMAYESGEQYKKVCLSVWQKSLCVCIVILCVFPIFSNGLIRTAEIKAGTGHLKEAIVWYTVARTLTPFWPLIYVQESEVWNALNQ